MRTDSQKTKLAILLHYVGEWRKRAGSRESVAQTIVETHIAAGRNSLPKLQFDTTGDIYTLAKNAADRIFRWLDDATKDSNFLPFNFEDSILAAMPADIRLAYLNEWLGQFGLSARGTGESVETKLDATRHLVALTKECSEANVAVAGLINGATESQIALADRELAEAEEAIRVTRADIRAHRAIRAVA